MVVSMLTGKGKAEIPTFANWCLWPLTIWAEDIISTCHLKIAFTLVVHSVTRQVPVLGSACNVCIGDFRGSSTADICKERSDTRVTTRHSGEKKHLSNAQHGLQADKKGLFWSIAWFILQCFSTQCCLHKVTRRREVTEHRVPPLWRGTWFISYLEVPVSSWHAQWCQNKIHHPTAICSFAASVHSSIIPWFQQRARIQLPAAAQKEMSALLIHPACGFTEAREISVVAAHSKSPIGSIGLTYLHGQVKIILIHNMKCSEGSWIT